METPQRMAPCGIDCTGCEIFHAAQDVIKANRLAENWRAAGMEKAEAGWFRCQGCWGDRTLCWTDDCAIFRCCVEERHLTSCSACVDFPCATLRQWAEGGERHREAFTRLKAMQPAGS